MKIPIFQVDAFTDTPFHGNPAAVCPLNEWLPDGLLQKIALENNLSETAFFVPDGDGFHLRWFTPSVEVDLCGHATLAAAFVIFNHTRPEQDEIEFTTRSGRLIVKRAGDSLQMDFPKTSPSPCEAPDGLLDAVGGDPSEILAGPQYVLVFSDEAAVRALAPDMSGLLHLDRHGVICTAKGEGAIDFVSRYFVPQSGVPEDPVTGSAHCTLAPLWSKKLGKTTLLARQVSARGGELRCTVTEERVEIVGKCVPYMEGMIDIT